MMSMMTRLVRKARDMISYSFLNLLFDVLMFTALSPTVNSDQSISIDVLGLSQLSHKLNRFEHVSSRSL